MFGITVLALVGPPVFKRYGGIEEIAGRWRGTGA